MMTRDELQAAISLSLAHRRLLDRMSVEFPPRVDNVISALAMNLQWLDDADRLAQQIAAHRSTGASIPGAAELLRAHQQHAPGRAEWERSLAGLREVQAGRGLTLDQAMDGLRERMHNR